jgi:hypothetical protein
MVRGLFLRRGTEMRQLIYGIAALCLLGSGGGAHAESGTTFVIGAGHDSCGQFIATIGKHAPGMMGVMPTGDGDFVSKNAEYQQWLLGFVSGFNVAHPDEQKQVRGIDLAGMDLWMRNWCNKNLTQTVFEGASVFIAAMLTKR